VASYSDYEGFPTMVLHPSHKEKGSVDEVKAKTDGVEIPRGTKESEVETSSQKAFMVQLETKSLAYQTYCMDHECRHFLKKLHEIPGMPAKDKDGKVIDADIADKLAQA